MDSRVVAWVSAGAASAIAAKLALKKYGDRVTLAYCETGSEHEDNERFLGDLVRWYGRPIERLKSAKYADTWDVWEKRKYLAGIDGAPCTLELKLIPRLAFQRLDDIHVFGYTNDKLDIARAVNFRKNFPELKVETPLIDGGLDKRACLAMLMSANILAPILYALGFPNNNCIPCVKATSPDYWALVRMHFPVVFFRMATLARSLDVRLARIKDERVFIDEIPDDWPVLNPIVPACDFLCHLAELELADG
jgi:hypothetical protein